MGSVAKDLTGQHFGRLSVMRRDGVRNGHITWLCQCQCGTRKLITGGALRSGGTVSCGCYWQQRRKEAKTTHGLSSHSLYSRWNMMIQRCTLNTNKSYPRYGGRGIRVCRAWRRFPTFYVWAIANGYRPDLWLKRKNNDGNYTPRNCKWATLSEQARNRRPVKLTSHQVMKIKKALASMPYGASGGKKAALARRFGVSPSTISNIATGATHRAALAALGE